MYRTSWLSYAALGVGAAALGAVPGFAEEATLQSHDGTIRMVVDVLDFDDETIRVRSPVGEFTFDLASVNCEGPGCPVPKAPTSLEPDSETIVTLTTRVGAVDITGELRDFTGAEYVLLTPTGEYRLRADTVTCSGSACPDAVPPAAEATVTAAEDPPLTDPAATRAVTLTTDVGGIEIKGELLEFTGTEYVLLTPTGEYRLQAGTVTCTGAACPDAAAPAAAPISEVAQETPQPQPAATPTITLTTNVGGIDITGDLIEFTGTEYILFTPTGEYRLRADTVTCSGAACPESAPQSPEAPAVVTEESSQPDVAAAPTVTLTTNVGAIEITGKLLGFDGTEYVLFTPTGEYRLQAATVSCSGEACPLADMQASPVARAAQQVPSEFAAFTPADADLRISGSDAVGLGLLPSLWKGYADWRGLKHELVQLSDTETISRFIESSDRVNSMHYVAASGPEQPFAALISRSAEFGLVARSPNRSETRALLSSGAGDLTAPENNTVIAVESIAMIVHPDNPVNALSLEQIAAIYRGAITNWADVGGADAPILVLSRNDDSGTQEIFNQAVGGGFGFRETARAVYPTGGHAGMRQAVLQEPNAIGYVAFGSADGVKRLNLSHSCGLTSVATPFSVKTEEYPLVRRHYLYARPDTLTPEAQRFVDYMRSPAAEAAVAASDLVNFTIELQPEDVAEDRYDAVLKASYGASSRQLARVLAEDLRAWDRLSTTFRFATGSSRLGTKEMSDIKRLIAYLAQQASGTEVAIVGFADSVGRFESNLRLSRARASLVAQTIEAEGGQALAGIRLTTKAFSELAPAACNTDEDGRRINRRVEIWIRRPG